MNTVAKSTDTGAHALDLFLRAFSARDIAEAIPSFDDTTPSSSIRAAMMAQKLEIAGIRRAGFMVAWYSSDDLAEGAEIAAPRGFDPATVIAETAPLHLVVQGLNASPYLFVQSFGQISGFLRRSDLLRPAVRMWLFGLVTITELRMTRLIDEILPQEAWQRYLSPSRVQMAAELQGQRRKRNQQCELLDCLQFADKARIVTRHDELRKLTRFSSRRATEEFSKDFQNLRNSLAHSQDILNDWPIILDLATNLHRFVLGPELPTETTRDLATPAAGSNHEASEL